MLDRHRDAAALPLLLKELKLGTVLRHWEAVADQAHQAHWTHSQFLMNLVELEVAERKQRRIARYIAAAKLPVGKTIDTFEFKATPSLNSAHIIALLEQTDWVDQASNILLFGPSGVGKTHLAAAIGYRLIEQGIKVLFSSTTAMVQQLQRAKKELRLPEMLDRLGRFPVVILDDIGYAKKSDTETSVLFELIAERYESGSMIITSNQSFGDWDQIFPDSVMAVAAIDRLVHHSSIFNITDESYRKRHVMGPQQHINLDEGANGSE